MASAGGGTPQSDNVAHALAGAGGGLLSTALTYPLITLSTRAQVESRRSHSSVLDAVRRIIEREGLAGLYSGLESALFGIGLTNFVYYYWYEWTRAAFEKAARKAGRTAQKLTTIEYVVAGALAGSATVLLTNPIWVVNTRMTARKHERQDDGGSSSSNSSSTTPPPPSPSLRRPPPPSTMRTFISLVRREGVLSLFRGVLPALVLVVNPILQYTMFEQLRNILARRRRVTSTDIFFLGALAKLIATTVTYPYITVKSRMHMATTTANRDAKKHHGALGSLRRIAEAEGWTALYKGIGPKITQSVLAAAFLFAFKDLLYELSVRGRQRLSRKRFGR